MEVLSYVMIIEMALVLNEQRHKPSVATGVMSSLYLKPLPNIQLTFNFDSINHIFGNIIFLLLLWRKQYIVQQLNEARMLHYRHRDIIKYT